MEQDKWSLKNFEPAFYGLVTIFFATMIFWNGYVPNNDGFTHLMNSKIIVDLLTGSCLRTAEIFQFNPKLVPNWGAQALMAALLYSGISAAITEKILFALCIALPAFGLRRLIAAMKGNLLFSWLGLSLALNSYVLYGVYSYALGTALAFYTIAFYLNHRDHIAQKCRWAIFCLLLCLTWWSHIIAYLFLGLVLTALELPRFITYLKQRHLLDKNKLALYFATIPSLVFTVLYVIAPIKPSEILILPANDIYLFLNRLVQLITLHDFISFLSLNSWDEVIVRLLLYLPIVLFLTFLSVKTLRSTDRPAIALPIACCALILMVLAVAPIDAIKDAWFISWRWRGLFWYSTIILASLSAMRSWNKQILYFMIAYCFIFSFITFYMNGSSLHEHYQKRTKNFPTFPANSVIYGYQDVPIDPIYIMANQMSNCLIRLDNYQTRPDLFPITLKNDDYHLPIYNNVAIDKKSLQYTKQSNGRTILDLDKYQRHTGIKIDYIVKVEKNTPDLRPVINISDPKSDQYKTDLAKKYNPVLKSEDLQKSYRRIFANKVDGLYIQVFQSKKK